MSWVWPIRTLVVGGESTSCLLVMGEQGSVCTSGQVQEGSGVWGRLRRGGSRMERGGWQMGQLVLGSLVFKMECSVEMALASVGQQPICWRAGASTLSLRVSGYVDAPGLHRAYLCPSSPGPTTLLEHQPASDLNH